MLRHRCVAFSERIWRTAMFHRGAVRAPLLVRVLETVRSLPIPSHATLSAATPHCVQAISMRFSGVVVRLEEWSQVMPEVAERRGMRSLEAA
jgi:hypothetical protein